MQNMFTKKSFQCNRYCGQCCIKFIIRLNNLDIKKIKNLGYKEEDFFTKDMVGSKFILKKNEKGCIFLKKRKDGKYSCIIYKNRPKTCQQYPFFKNKNKLDSCLPQEIYTSAFVSLKKPK